MPWFGDSGAPLQVEKLSSGALRVTANLARTGIQEYSPALFEQTRGKLTRKVRIYRPPEVVFDPESMATVADKAVTIGHPKGGTMITQANWRDYAKGHAASSEPERVKDGDEEWLRTRIIVSASDAVAGVESKKLSRLSQGYHGEIDWTPGKSPSGAAYDAIVTKIVHNHTALLGAGEARAGDGARIFLDSNTEETTMTEEEKKALIAEVTEAVLAAIEAKAKEKEGETPAADAVQDAANAKANAEAQAKATAAEGAAKAAQALGDSNAQQLAIIDAKDRTQGMLPADYVFTGKSSKQIKLDALKKALPTIALTDADDEIAIDAALGVVASARTKFFADSKPAPAAPAEHRAAHAKRMQGAFKPANPTNGGQ